MHITVVGLGPGDPELITLKGIRAIEAARVVFAPRTGEAEASRALRIAQPWIDESRQQVVPLTLPMTKDTHRLAASWRAAAEQIGSTLARMDTPRAVYLLLGDPLLYGTFTYILGELAAHSPALQVEVIPGITSFAAAAARLKLPLCTQDDRVAIVPASQQTDSAALRQLCAQFDTIIIMKVGRVLPQVLAALDEVGLLGHAVYAEHVGMPEERIVDDVASLRDEQGPYLSLLIVRQPHSRTEDSL
jgi:precorrin-2/cobalt-factor-2 C20-methyltransferase